MSHALLLVERLEQLALHEHVEDPELLAQLVAERATILSDLQAAETSSLSAEQRAEFRERLTELVARDALLMEFLATRQEETRQALEQLRSGRRAAHGYAQTLSSSPPPPSRRFG